MEFSDSVPSLESLRQNLLDLGMYKLSPNHKITVMNILEELGSAAFSDDPSKKQQENPQFAKEYEKELIQLKEIFIKLLKNLNDENKAESIKEEELNTMKTICKENKIHLTRLRENIRHQSHKIKLLERKLSQSPEALNQTIQQKRTKPIIKVTSVSPGLKTLNCSKIDMKLESPKLKSFRPPRSRK